MNLLLNFAAFQFGWFASVLGAANGFAWAGPVAVLAVLGLHLLLADRPRAELRLALLAMAVGLLADSLALATGWLRYPAAGPVAALAPAWIVCMWALFATTLNHSMRWLHGRPLLALLMGAVGGPLSYLAGAKLGAMELLRPAPALALLALIWAVALPLLVGLAEWLDRTAPRGQPATANAGEPRHA